MNTVYKFLIKNKFVIMGGILLVLIICLIITAVRVFGNKTDGAETTLPQTQSDTESDNASISGDTSFLVVCTDDSKMNIVFMCIFDFRIYSGNVIVTSLDASTAANGGTYASLFAYGGINTLKAAVENVRSCAVDRYVMIDRSGFYEFFDNFGKIHINVEEPYTYESSDKNNFVESGENDLDPTMLYSYIKLNAGKPDGNRRVAELICLIADDCIRDIDKDDAAQLFKDLINCVDTDFTISDFNASFDDIQYMTEHDISFVLYENIEQ